MTHRASFHRALAAGVATALLALAAQAGAGQCFSGGRPPQQAQLGLRIGGVAEGSVGGLELSLNGGFDTLVLTQPGAFAFRRGIADGGVYDVRITRHPTARHCTVEGGQGLALAPVADLRVRCRAGDIAALPAADGPAGNAGPFGPLLRDAQGRLYACTERGGEHDRGAVVRIDPDGSRVVLHSFALAGEMDLPLRLALSADGQFLYGVSQRGGEHNQGTLFRLRIDGSDYQVLHSFDGEPAALFPSSGLLLASDGRYYGLTANEGGTLYRYDPQGGFQVMHRFAAEDLGSEDADTDVEQALPMPAPGLRFPIGDLVEGDDGALYGAAAFGGAGHHGGVFRYGLQSRRLRTLVALPEGSGPPFAGLARGRNGNLYAISSASQWSQATLFRVTPQGQLSAYTVDPLETRVARPRGVLVEGSDGRFYGVSEEGGAHGHGTVFAVDFDAVQLTLLYSFGDAGQDEAGSHPRHGLLAAPNGDLYGTTADDGPVDRGAVFRID